MEVFGRPPLDLSQFLQHFLRSLCPQVLRLNPRATSLAFPSLSWFGGCFWGSFLNLLLGLGVLCTCRFGFPLLLGFPLVLCSCLWSVVLLHCFWALVLFLCGCL